MNYLTPREYSYTKYDEFGAATESGGSDVLINKSTTNVCTYASSKTVIKNDAEHRPILARETRKISGGSTAENVFVTKYAYND